MTMTIYDPEASTVAGNFAIYFLPAVADFMAPTIAEHNAGIKVDCATETWGPTAEVSKTSRQKLCDKYATEKAGQRKRGLSDMTFSIGNPQEQNAFLDKVTEGSTWFVYGRPGLDDEVPVAAGQKEWGTEVEIGTVSPTEVNTAEGTEFGVVVTFITKQATEPGSPAIVKA